MPPSRPSASRPRAICAALRHARKCLCQRIERPAAAPDEGFAHGFVTVVAAVEAGFRHEELIVETLGFAQLQEHRAGNAVALSALHRVLPDVEGGDCALGRQVLAALLHVLELHRLSTDLALTVAVQPMAAGTPGRRAARRRARPDTSRRGGIMGVSGFRNLRSRMLTASATLPAYGIRWLGMDARFRGDDGDPATSGPPAGDG